MILSTTAQMICLIWIIINVVHYLSPVLHINVYRANTLCYIILYILVCHILNLDLFFYILYIGRFWWIGSQYNGNGTYIWKCDLQMNEIWKTKTHFSLKLFSRMLKEHGHRCRNYPICIIGNLLNEWFLVNIRKRHMIFISTIIYWISWDNEPLSNIMNIS